MGTLRRAWTEYREAVQSFSGPARRYLQTEFVAWTGHGVSQVLFNLYLVQAGFGTEIVGQAISLVGIGLALAALPAATIANRWGRRRSILLGVTLDGVGQILRCTIPAVPGIYAASLLLGIGQSFLQISGAPFLAEHSTPRERTHLFSAQFAIILVSGVAGSILGGWLPTALRLVPLAHPLSLLASYRIALAFGGAVSLTALLPLMSLRGLREAPHDAPVSAIAPEMRRRLVPIGVNALLIGAGAGLVIPFMNLYFASRFQCSSAQIGSFFSIAQIFTALASLLGPVVARHFGKLRTAVVAELLSLPFLVTLGIEHRLETAVVVFWIRATLMQAASPLLSTFIMEALPPALRAPGTSLMNLMWNIGWATSATLAGLAIVRFGYAVPFFITAGLYATAAVYFYLTFRGTPEGGPAPAVEEAQGSRGEGPISE
jgi:MFS family permease